jgi:hypothetical protein
MSRASALFIVPLLLAVNCLAQVEQGAVSGVVTDSSGAVIPKAKVTATNQATGVAATSETTGEGYYKLPYLLPGSYALTVEKDGFSTNRVTGVPVQVGQTATINVELKTGSVHDEITVAASAVMIDQTGSSLGYVGTTAQILDLPTGRNPFALLVLSPGVLNTGNSGTGPIVNGGRSNTTAILLDGQDTRNNSTLDNAYSAPQEAVSEVRFITNSFSAEYGRSTGGVVIAESKTGANALHGSAYDYLNNDDLNANSWTNNLNHVARGRQRQNVYGFSISGPVYLPKVYNGKNKTFFFFNFEQNNNHGVSTPAAAVPTLLQKTGNFSQTSTASGQLIQLYDPLTTLPSSTTSSGYIRSPFPGNIIPPNRIDPITAKILAYYPNPTLAVSPTIQNDWSLNFGLITHQDRYFARVDENLSQKNRLFFRYGYSTSPQTSPYLNNPNASVAFPGETTNGGGNQQSISYNYGISDTQTFTPNLVAEFRIGYNRSIFKLLPLSIGFDTTSIGLPQYLKNASADALFPYITVSGMTAIGPQRASHDIDGENTPEAQAHLTWLKGNHAIKTGFDLLLAQFNTFRPDYPSGTFDFNTAYTQGPDPAVASATSGYGFASALLGSPDSGQFTIGPSLALLQKVYTAYVQDDWKVTRTLTINLGYRFEYETPYKERYNHLGYFDPNGTDPITGLKGILTQVTPAHPYPSNPQYDSAPRVGLAWNFRPKTVFRAAYGIFYAPGSGGVGQSPGDLGSASETATGIYFGQTPAAPNTPIPGASLSNPFVTGLLSYPNSLVGQGIGAIFPNWKTPMNQMWNANIQRNLTRDLLVEVAYIGTRGEHIWNNINEDATYPQELSLGTQLNSLVPNPFFGKITNGALSAATVRLGSLLVPYPQYSGVTWTRGSVGDSIYHGLTLRAERAFAHGLMFQASYTFAKLIDDVNERFLGGANFINPYNLRQSRSISTFDVPQRFVANYIYALPFGHGKQFLSHGIASYILGNWENTGIVTAQEGTPISISASCNLPGVSGLGCTAVRTGNINLPSGQQTMNQWFNTAAFTNPGPYSFGTDSRTEPNLRNPGTFSWDTSLSRWQPIKERMRLQFRADMYDWLNHPNLGSPSASITSSTFGRITSKSGNRTITMALRLEF